MPPSTDSLTTEDALAAWASADEFAGIMVLAAGEPATRGLMSVPPRTVASRRFIADVDDLLDRAGGDAQVVADWMIDKLERYGARTARPVFDMEGNGPLCSWCGTLWPLCGHHHQSLEVTD